jgi:hypothetical protein
MPSLRELQLAFFAALGTGAAGTTEPDVALLAAVDGGGTLDACARVDVYAQMYWMRIADALLEDFPRLAALVGDARFHTLARTYLVATPSRHPSLRYVGDGFADFLATHAADDLPPFAADLARLEWARLDVFDAPDAAVLTLADLRCVVPEEWAGLRLRAVPASTVLTLAWPVHTIWAAENAASGVWEPAATTLRVWRDEFHVYQSSMDSAEAAAFAALRAGGTFGDVCAAIGSAVPAERAAEHAGALLLRWIDDRVLAAPTS